jgi:hypothetical protein
VLGECADFGTFLRLQEPLSRFRIGGIETQCLGEGARRALDIVQSIAAKITEGSPKLHAAIGFARGLDLFLQELGQVLEAARAVEQRRQLDEALLVRPKVRGCRPTAMACPTASSSPAKTAAMRERSARATAGWPAPNVERIDEVSNDAPTETITRPSRASRSVASSSTAPSTRAQRGGIGQHGAGNARHFAQCVASCRLVFSSAAILSSTAHRSATC